MIAVEGIAPIKCICCGQVTRAPTLEMVLERYGLPPMQRRVLTALWKGRGLWVASERLYDAMYADDRNGGPARVQTVRDAFKWHLHHMRKKLEGSGVKIVAGYRNRQFRLAFGDE